MKLKGKNIAIKKSLAATRMKKLKEAKEIYDFKNVQAFKDGSGNAGLFYD